MASIDLNIIDCGIHGNVWTAQNTGIQSSQLDKIKESRTDNSVALNSLPTPFARFFVVKEAFRRVAEDKRTDNNCSGLAYMRLVSDCLDIFELLFYKKFFDNQWGNSKRIVIKEWNRKEHMKELQDKVPILFHALNDTYNQDINESILFFVVLEQNGKNLLLATSSPMTGFATAPDIELNSQLYNDVKIKRKVGRGEYFNDILLFDERDKDFKNYMYQLFGNSVDDKFNLIRDYIRLFKDDKDIQDNYSIKLGEIVTELNSPLVVNNLKISFTDETDISDFFLPKLIRLPYRLNRDNFLGINYEREPQEERDYDYLLPLKSEALSYLEQGNAKCLCSIKKYEVIVTFFYNGNEYNKVYRLSDDVRNLKEDNHNLNIGLFPNILSAIDTENNYFKLALSVADKNKDWHNLSVDDVSLSFFKRDNTGSFIRIEEVDYTRAQNGVKDPVVRSKQGSGNYALNCSTKYYELFNTDFDAIELTIGCDSGFLFPKWRKATNANESYTYAIDLGTSNTFISRKNDNDNNVPEMFNMTAPMVSYLHEYNVNKQYSVVSAIENSMSEEARRMMKTEFVPSFIDGFDYKFPIRTVICKSQNINDTPELFDNHNIAFFYEKMMRNNYEECLTDIKWNENEDCLKILIKELLLIIKCDILQRNGVLNQTNIVWFRPISFSGNSKRIYDRMWKKLPKEIIFSDNVTCYTESEAPYYYFKKMDIVKNTDAVTVIDIGGGSTDYVYFNENKSVSASSVHFGCNVLWSNGHNEFNNIRENGIYNKYIENLRWKKNQDLSNLESEMKNNKKCTTTDIINFWLSNSKNNDIVDRLHNDFMPLFVYHFTSIIYYIAKLYKYKNYVAPRSIIFSGNGSRYIDNFITDDSSVIEEIVTSIFNSVFGNINSIHVVMPSIRKESTCYGGLYRSKMAQEVPEMVYHGVDKEYENVGEMNNDNSLQTKLLENYKEMNSLYNSALDILKRNDIIDQNINLDIYKSNAFMNYDENLNTHYRSDVKEKYSDTDICNDSVFFIPVIDKIYELSKLN